MRLNTQAMAPARGGNPIHSLNGRYVNRCTGDNNYPTIQAGPKPRLLPGAMAVVAMTSNGFSIADPGGGGMLDVAGFNASAPQVIATSPMAKRR